MRSEHTHKHCQAAGAKQSSYFDGSLCHNYADSSKAMVHCNAGSAPDTPFTMDSSSPGAGRRLRHDATKITTGGALACSRRHSDFTRCNGIDNSTCPRCTNLTPSINRKCITWAYRNADRAGPSDVVQCLHQNNEQFYAAYYNYVWPRTASICESCTHKTLYEVNGAGKVTTCLAETAIASCCWVYDYNGMHGRLRGPTN